MSQELLDKLTADARYVQVVIPYHEGNELITFDDGFMTELECDEDFVVPTLNKDTLLMEYVFDLQTGKVVNWKEENGYLRMWGKVQDEGVYTLLNKDKQPISQISGYVPWKLLPPYEQGFGDYLELAVERDGTLRDWRQEVDLTDFAGKGQESKPIKTNKWYRAEEALWHIQCKQLNIEEISWLIDKLKKEYKL